MVGIFFGSLAFGYISDKFGRIAALLLGIATVCLSSIIGVFMPTAIGYGVFRFLSGGHYREPLFDLCDEQKILNIFEIITISFLMYIGMGCAGCFGAPFILVIEYSGKSFTTYIGIAIAIPFSLGMVLFGIDAYYIRDWETLQLVSLAPWLILIPILWKTVPESPRWLISMKRYKTLYMIFC